MSIERSTIDIFHDQVRQSVLLFDGMDRDHIRMAHGGGGTCFAAEPPSRPRTAGELPIKHLDGHGAMQRLVEATEHHAHAAMSNNAQDFVLPQTPQGKIDFRGERNLVLQALAAVRPGFARLQRCDVRGAAAGRKVDRCWIETHGRFDSKCVALARWFFVNLAVKRIVDLAAGCALLEMLDECASLRLGQHTPLQPAQLRYARAIHN
jgi:hypothetical protein